MLHFRQQEAEQPISDTLLTVGFLVLIFLPLFAMILPTYRVYKSRAAAIQKMPVSSLQDYKQYSWLRPVVVTFDATQVFLYNFKNTLALRDPFVRLHGIAKVKGLNTSSSSSVVLGKQDWFFYSGNESIEDYRHLAPFAPRKLEQIGSDFEELQNRLEKRGIKFLVVIAPDKHSIYPEFMPDNLQPVNGQTRLDQFMTMMETHPEVPILDLRPALLQAKRDELVYDPTDTHWNGIGSLVAYQATADRLRTWYPNLKVVTREEFKISTRLTTGGDLTRLLGIQEDTSQKRFLIKPLPPRVFPPEQKTLPKSRRDLFRHQTIMRHKTGEIPRVMVFGDSFTGTIFRPLLSQHFEQGSWIRFGRDRTIYFDLVDQFKPDLVIFQTVERQLSEVTLDPRPRP